MPSAIRRLYRAPTRSRRTEQLAALSGTLEVTDGTSSDDVIGLYLGTGGDNIGVTAPLASSPNAMYGFGGDDNLTGGTAGDFMFGGIGTDTLNGGAGNDTYSSVSPTAATRSMKLEEPIISSSRRTVRR